MKQIPVEKYTIAFFRLAEYVARGEKERALGVYRLLSHSFDDVAFARQLEGDILLSFNDDAAQEKYFQAAQMYHKEMRLHQAIGVYEHLVTLHPKVALYCAQLIDIYLQLNMQEHAKLHAAKLLDTVATHENIPVIAQALEKYDQIFAPAQCMQFHEKFVYGVIKSGYSELSIAYPSVRYIVDYCVAHQCEQDVQQFFDVVHRLDGAVYLYAHNYYTAK